MCDGICNKCWRSDICDQDYVSDYAEVENTDALSAEAMSHCQNDQDIESARENSHWLADFNVRLCGNG